MQTTMWALVVLTAWLHAAGAVPAAEEAAAPARQTTPLDRAWVSSRAEWVVHVDAEAWNASKIGRFIMDHAEAFDLDLDELEEFEKETGLDPLADLLGVTAYGWGSGADEQVVVVAVTTARADEALARLKASDESRTLVVGGHAVHTVPGDDVLVHLRTAPQPDRRVAVVSEHQETLAHALAVMDGREPGLVVGQRPLLTAPRPGSFLFVAASSMDDLPELEAASEVLRLAEACVIDLGEHDGLVQAYATASAANTEDAGNITQIIRGILALGALMFEREGEMAPVRALVDATDVQAHDDRVTVGIRFPVDGVVEALKHLVEEADGH